VIDKTFHKSDIQEQPLRWLNETEQKTCDRRKLAGSRSTGTIEASAKVSKMTEIITLELPEPLAQQAKAIAALTHRRLEDVLVEWIDRAITDLPIESLPDPQVLALWDSQLPHEQQTTLSDLLALNQKGQLGESDRQQLDELMKVYRLGLVRKARALQVAVSRGLRPPLAS
jgi:hypothetical protein